MRRFVYFITNGTHHKIGISNDPEKRLRQLQTGSSETLSLDGMIEADDDFESLLHEELSDWHVRGEWFLLDEDARMRIFRLCAEYDLEEWGL